MKYLLELIALIIAKIFKDGVKHERTSENVEADIDKRNDLADRLKLYFEDKSDFRR